MNIEIITTPNDALKESGFGTLKACNNALKAIQRMGYNVQLTVCEKKDDLNDVIRRKPGLIVLAVKYISLKNQDDIWLSDYFSKNAVNFTGSSREVLKFDSSKHLAKIHLSKKGIKTANYFLAIPGQYKNESELPITFPLFLKPSDAANGCGIDASSFVSNFEDYEYKVTSLYNSFNQEILAEEYLDGREFTVAVIKTTNESLVISAIEVIPPIAANGIRILGSQVKHEDSEKLSKINDNDLQTRVIAMATEAFNALGIRDFGRIDIKTDHHGECYFMEANLAAKTHIINPS